MKQANEKMKIYEALRKVPEDAIKKIEAGNLKGMSNINPMWRIKALTEQFGPCGIGWYVEEVERWNESFTVPVKINNQYTEQLQVAVYMKIHLFVKIDGEWSNPILGFGGSKEAGKGVGDGISDECYKMAYTDALSVACKALGIGADVYYEADITKYGVSDSVEQQQREFANMEQKNDKDQLDLLNKIHAATNRKELDAAWAEVVARFGKGTDYYNNLFKAAGDRGRELFSTSKRKVRPETQLAPESAKLEDLNVNNLL